ncbi:MAG: SHOCT domain-containing protein [Micrococcales bacterium]|nr:SHOCT domain-containing protein [Micrococcales bacterium]
MSFWDVIWFIIVSFAFIAYLLVLFNIVVDLFRDRDTSGWVKAIWIVFLVIIPLLTSLVYLIARGRGMAERQMSAVSSAREQQDAYIRQVAATSPAEQIGRAKDLLDSGAITQQEFEALKAKALG